MPLELEVFLWPGTSLQGGILSYLREALLRLLNTNETTVHCRKVIDACHTVKVSGWPCNYPNRGTRIGIRLRAHVHDNPTITPNCFVGARLLLRASCVSIMQIRHSWWYSFLHLLPAEPSSTPTLHFVIGVCRVSMCVCVRLRSAPIPVLLQISL